MMYAIYFKNPNTGEYIPCTSSRHMYFEEGAAPTLFAQFKNAEKALKDYARVIGQYPNQRVYRASIKAAGRAAQVDGITTEHIENLYNYFIAPVLISPDLDNVEPPRIPQK